MSHVFLWVLEPGLPFFLILGINAYNRDLNV